ncbi:hypothetical protein [Actinacidiphila acididurans]|uniref:Ig-like domain repeat protein n=1 Tax=Actinacidiphila acididurans TaxID=2784346 RepID=A0ABS2U1N8_9ACTN|nr:hypothetical protein [Actinacidiphila acididurans]MBM9508103.1 hypothetical protein [Actinacidiphila acididurans]
MKLKRLRLAAAVAVVTGLTVAGTAGAAPAAGSLPSTPYVYPAGPIPLPLAHFSHLVVDGHGHVFVSGGAGDPLVVTGLDGQGATAVDGVTGATGLALSADGTTLYAALPDQDAIAAISTATLTQTARYATGAGTRPDSLAIAGGSLWFGYGTTGAGGLGSVDAAGTVTLGLDGGTWAGPPVLTTTPTSSDALAAAVQDGPSADVVTYRITGGTPQRLGAGTLPVPDLTDIALTADGQDLLVTSWSHPYAFGLRLTDLTTDQYIGSGLGGPALAVAPDGSLAGCSCRDSEIDTFPMGREGFYTEHELPYIPMPGTLRVAPHGLAWAPDNSRVYGAVTDASGGSPALMVVSDPETAYVSAGASWSGPAPGEPYTFTVALDATLDPDPFGSPLPGDVRFVRYDDADPDGVPVTDAVAVRPDFGNDYGSFRITGTAPPTGGVSFRVIYSGSGHLAPLDRTFDEHVGRYAPRMTLSAPATAGRAVPLTVKGTLTWPHAHVPTGRVTVVRTDPAHPSGSSIGSLPVAADGGFAFQDSPPVGGTNTYRFTYDGGSAYLPVSASSTVQVSRAVPALSVTTDAGSYHYGGTVKVTAHLGTTYNSRTVTLYAQPAGGHRTVLRSAGTDAHGNLVAYTKAAADTTFSASFGGDYRYAPRTVSRTVGVVPTVQTRLDHPVGTTRIGSTTYQVFFTHEVDMGVNLKIPGGQSTGCSTLYIEHWYGGAWHRDAQSRCLPVYGDGQFSWLVPLKHFAPDGRYRVVGHYAPPAQGARTTGAWGTWTYLTVRRG